MMWHKSNRFLFIKRIKYFRVCVCARAASWVILGLLAFLGGVVFACLRGSCFYCWDRGGFVVVNYPRRYLPHDKCKDSKG